VLVQAVADRVEGDGRVGVPLEGGGQQVGQAAAELHDGQGVDVLRLVEDHEHLTDLVGGGQAFVLGGFQDVAAVDEGAAVADAGAAGGEDGNEPSAQADGGDGVLCGVGHVTLLVSGNGAPGSGA
jgi:hypothetical protein